MTRCTIELIPGGDEDHTRRQVVGMYYLISVHDAQVVRMDQDESGIFVLDFTRGSATDKTAPAAQAVGKYLSASAVRSYLIIACFKVGKWTTIGHVGAWTIEA